MDQSTVTTVLMVIVTTFGPVLAVYIVHLYRQAQERIKKQQWYALASEFARTAVLAAEQLGLSGEIDEYARGRYDYALTWMTNMLATHGIRVDIDLTLDMLKGMIEAEVLQLPKTSEAKTPLSVAPPRPLTIK